MEAKYATNQTALTPTEGKIMQTPAKIRINQSTACQLLDISRDGLKNLIDKDPTFPRRIKEGEARQSPVYFDYSDLMKWHESKKLAYATPAANDSNIGVA
jgi:predicted DNA-binding transcriptional regulator AlpA